jgi:lysozyme family protein
MSHFERIFAIVAGEEGGYSDRNLADDPGGKTNFGVTEKVARRHGYRGDMKDLPREMATAIARMDYWDKYKCDEFHPAIALQVFDAAYNGGSPALWLQGALGVKTDGAIGPKTIAAAKAANIGLVIAYFDARRLLYMTDLDNWHANSRGWAKRVARMQLEGVKLCAQFPS